MILSGFPNKDKKKYHHPAQMPPYQEWKKVVYMASK
jgi:hypothetical protein